MGGCNLFAEEVSKMFSLPCYMVYHEYIDYDKSTYNKNTRLKQVTYLKFLEGMF